MINEQIIIERFREGDTLACEKIFHEYYKSLVIYAGTMLKNRDDAEDVVQQVYVNIWEKRERLEIHTSLKAFLYRAVYHTTLNKLKQQSVREQYAGEIRSSAVLIQVDDRLQQKELQHKLDEAINELPEQCARIFKMSRYDQLKYQQIADALDLSVKTVENQMGKALKLLREKLKDYLPLLILILSHYYRD